MSLSYTRSSALNIYLTLRSLVTGRVSYKELHGPIGIASAAYQVAQEGWISMLLFLGYLSVNLAVLNFLPIPVLDGGHMVFLLWEAGARRKPNEKIFVGATYVGLAFLVCLMAACFVSRLLHSPVPEEMTNRFGTSRSSNAFCGPEFHRQGFASQRFADSVCPAFDGDRARSNQCRNVCDIAKIPQDSRYHQTETLFSIRLIRRVTGHRIDGRDTSDPFVESRRAQGNQSRSAFSGNKDVMRQRTVSLSDRIKRAANVMDPLSQQRPSQPKCPFGGMVIGGVTNLFASERELARGPQFRGHDGPFAFAKMVSQLTGPSRVGSLVNIEHDRQASRLFR